MKQYIMPSMLGLGLALIAFHSFWPINSVIGHCILLGLVALFLIKHITNRKRIELGPKGIYIPIAILLLVSIIQVAVGITWTSPLIYMLAMVLIYLMSREYDGKAFYILIPVVLAVSFSCIIMNGIINPGSAGGGIIHYIKYNLAAGFMAIGMTMARSKWQWFVVTLTIPGILMTGADEGLVFLIGLGLLVLVKRDFGKRLIPVGLVLVLAVLAFTVSGTIQTFYTAAWSRIQMVTEIPGDGSDKLHEITRSRWHRYEDAVKDIQVWGHGFDAAEDCGYMIHNVPLKILDDMGPIAMGAWLWLVGYGFFKLNRKYIFGAIILFSVFDNLMWTQLTPYMFVALGVSLPVNDYIFKSKGTVHA